MTVLVTTYEAIGEGAEIARKHYEEVTKIHAIWSQAAIELGADMIRFSSIGTPPRTLVFNGREPPHGWKYAGRPSRSTVEASPHRGTKRGKEAYAVLEALPESPTDLDLAAAFGWNLQAFEGMSIYFATAVKVVFPKPRYFLRLPRTPDDGWKRPETLFEVRESVLMGALEGHNDHVRQRKAELAA